VAAAPSAPARADDADLWPHTTRLLPWLIAVFLVMLWLFPFDGIDLRVQLPFDSKLDRALLGVIVLVWAASLLAGGPAAPRLRSSRLNRVVLVFVAVAVVSILLNLDRMELLGEADMAIKKLALLLSYVAFFFIVASSVRPGELRNFTILFVSLASIAALGTIWEYRTDFNAFYEWAGQLLPSGLFKVVPDRIDPRFERAAVTGPAVHGLAIATMLAIALPFAIAAGLAAKRRKTKLLYLVATAIILTGAVSTIRKTAAVVPVAALVTVFAFRPRELIRLAPVGLVLLIFMHGLAPGAAGQIKSQMSSLMQRQSTEGRTSDYDAIGPDILAHQTFGRGWGSYDAERYRLLDNEYLQLLITTGLIGLAAYLAMIFGVVAVAARPIRSRDPLRAPPALGAAAAAVAFAVATALFDVIAFPQVPYLFFFVGALAVVAASSEPRQREAPAPVPGWTGGFAAPPPTAAR
jgi:O-antigen ligase